MNKNSKTLFNSHLTLDGFNEARSLTIMQGDKTDLEFILKDKNSEPIDLQQSSGQAQVVDSEKDTLVAVFNVDVEGSKATFSIDKALPASEYEIYIKIGDYYFPSREDSFMLRVINSYDVVEDVDLDNVQTIDIVVDALRADIIEAMKPEVGGYVDQILADEPERFKGEKGDKFTIHDFTEEEWASLKGEDGNSLTFDQLDTEQQEALRGHSAYEVAQKEGFEGSPEEWFESLKGDKGDTGDSFNYEDFTQEQLDELRGETGQAFTYEMFTPEQLEALKGEQGEKGDDGDKGEAGVNGLHGNTTSVENNEDGSYDIVVTNPNSETEISRTTVRDGVDGTDGTDGIDGESLRYEDLTPEQIAELQEGLPVRPPKIYTRTEYYELDSYDPHTLYFVVEEEEEEEEGGIPQ